MRAKLSLAVASVLVSVLAATAPAEAACKRFGFTVNDYGKEGPTNDAKNLLDKHIAEWAAQSGVTAYQTGKKNVSCELFLDVILFDEHTCTASANVCWGDGVKPNNKGAEQAEATDAGNGEIPPAPVSKAEALGIPAQQQTAAAPADAAAPPAVDAAPTAPVEQIAAPAETPAATPAVQTAIPATAPTAPETPAATATAVVETGALQAGQGLAEKQVAPPAAPPQQDRAAAAAAAASAAAAAERAAQAAETAANAAKEAAAAAVAASAASKAPASVPPLGHASGAKPTHNE